MRNNRGDVDVTFIGQLFVWASFGLTFLGVLAGCGKNGNNYQGSGTYPLNYQNTSSQFVNPYTTWPTTQSSVLYTPGVDPFSTTGVQCDPGSVKIGYQCYQGTLDQVCTSSAIRGTLISTNSRMLCKYAVQVPQGQTGWSDKNPLDNQGRRTAIKLIGMATRAQAVMLYPSATNIITGQMEVKHKNRDYGLFINQGAQSRPVPLDSMGMFRIVLPPTSNGGNMVTLVGQARSNFSYTYEVNALVCADAQGNQYNCN